MTWPEWSCWFADAFAARREEELNMLAVWVELFVSRSWTPDEVTAACRSCFDRISRCRYRSEYLAVITEAVEGGRVSALRDACRRADADPRGVCCDCSNSGMMSGMPHPAPPPDQPWVTCAVLCHCPLGRWLQGRQDERRLMTYLEYTARVPDWHDRQEAYHRTLAARSRAQDVASALDKSLGSILTKAKAAAKRGA